MTFYASKPVRFITPNSAGSGADGMTRRLADHLQRALNQTSMVDNIPGAGGLLGSETLLRIGPKDMPRDVVRKLNESMTAILHGDTFPTQIAPEGAVVAPMEPEALKAFMAAKYIKHGSLVARSGATIQ